MKPSLSQYPPISHPEYGGYRVALYEDKDGTYTLYLGFLCYRYYTHETLPDDIKFKLAIIKSHPPNGGHGFYINTNKALADVGWRERNDGLFCIVLEHETMKELNFGKDTGSEG